MYKQHENKPVEGIQYNKGELVWYWDASEEEPLLALCLETKLHKRAFSVETIQILFGEKIKKVWISSIARSKSTVKKDLISVRKSFESVRAIPAFPIQHMPSDNKTPNYVDFETVHQKINRLIWQEQKSKNE